MKVFFHGYQMRAILGDRLRYTLEGRKDTFQEITGHRLWWDIQYAETRMVDGVEPPQIIVYYVVVPDEHAAVEFKLKWL